RWTRDALVWTRHDRLWAAPFGRSGVAGEPRELGDTPAMYPSVSIEGDVLFVSADGLRLRSAEGAERALGRPVRYTPPVPEPLLIRNARIIDGTGSPATAPMDVAIVRGRIAAIVPAGTCEGASVGSCAGAVTGA